MSKVEEKLNKVLLQFFENDGFKEFARITQEEAAKWRERERLVRIKEKEAYLFKKNEENKGLDKEELSEWTYLKFLIEYHKLHG